jgi:hypothetical protein
MLDLTARSVWRAKRPKKVAMSNTQAAAIVAEGLRAARVRERQHDDQAAVAADVSVRNPWRSHQGILSELLPCSYRRRRSFGRNFAEARHIDVMGYHHPTHVVIHQQDRHSRGSEQID